MRLTEFCRKTEFTAKIRHKNLWQTDCYMPIHIYPKAQLQRHKLSHL